MKRLDTARRREIVAALVQGVRLREAARAAGVSRMTVGKLVHDLGAVCARYQRSRLQGLPCRLVQWEALWSFAHAGASDAAEPPPGVGGDVWTWVAFDVDTELVPAWLVGARDAETARVFVTDLAGRLRHPVRLGRNWGKPCLEAAEAGDGIRLADLLTALYGPEAAPSGQEPRAEPSATHTHAVALHLMHHNFVRMEPARGATPAMLAGVAERPWRIEDVVALLEAEEADAPPTPRNAVVARPGREVR